jgi:hypothetical protein
LQACEGLRGGRGFALEQLPLGCRLRSGLRARCRLFLRLGRGGSSQPLKVVAGGLGLGAQLLQGRRVARRGPLQRQPGGLRAVRVGRLALRVLGSSLAFLWGLLLGLLRGLLRGGGAEGFLVLRRRSGVRRR